MLTGILIIAIVGLLAILSHRRTRIEERIYKNVPLSDWLTILAFPLFMYIGWFFVVKNILERPQSSIIPFDDFDILAITILFMIYAFVGNALHLTGKILWKYLQGLENTMAYRVNEMFHGKLSHYLAFMNSLFIMFLLAILEINHPVGFSVRTNYLLITALAGITFGISGAKAIFYTNEWFGGYNKPLFFVTAVLLILLFSIIKLLELNLSFYPVILFISVMYLSFIATFIIRQFFIFGRLGKKRKLRFLAKILSA